MPIDFSLLRTSRSDIKRWQSARSLTHDDDTENLIEEILSLEDRRRAQHKTLNKAQSRLNDCRKLIELAYQRDPINISATNHNADKNESQNYTVGDIMEEIELLKNTENQLHYLSITLHRDLIPKLGNVIDGKDFSYRLPFPNYSITCEEYDFRDFVHDPLFCLKGYDEYPQIPNGQSLIHINASEDMKSNKEKILLSGVGSQLIHAISSYIHDYFYMLHLDEAPCRIKFLSTTTWIPLNVPSDIQVDSITAHLLMGCPKAKILKEVLKERPGKFQTWP